MEADTVLERRRLRRRASRWRIIAFLILIAAALGFYGLSTDSRLAGLNPQKSARGHVAEIKVSGFIATQPDAVDVIEAATKSDSVKAVVLLIDSPGGAATGGEALYHAVRAASAAKPVVAVIEGLGASAAYMTAIAADHVVARESAITGSIGVIFQYGHFEELLGKIGARYEEVKSAPLKGQPSPFQPPSPEAVRMLQAVVDDSYDWFVGLVAERRALPPDEARRLSDGSIYTGRQALRLKLVDEVGGNGTARAWLASQRGISADLSTREWKKDESVLSWFQSGSMAGLVRLLGIDPALYPAAAGLLPKRLAVDGLLSVWHVPNAVVRADP